MLYVALDLETECALGCNRECEHGLDPHRNRISVIGTYHQTPSGPSANTFRDVRSLSDFVAGLGDVALIGHNFKFDLKVLRAKGLDLSHLWAHDTLLMSSVLVEKVPYDYLQWYGAERKRLNTDRPKGAKHREGSVHSLKTLAPYFLGVPAFWEPENHDSDEYVLKDVEYTYRLFQLLEKKLHTEGSYDFYREKLLKWTRLLLDMECRGILIDLDLLPKLEEKAAKEAQEAKTQLDILWAPAYNAYASLRYNELREKYSEMCRLAVLKLKDKSKAKDTEKRYTAMLDKAQTKIEPLNLDSPAQLTWLMRDYLRLDITDFDGDETTGKPVLARLAGEGRTDIEQFLKYRKATKLATAFFPSYRDMQVGGAIHCSFNPTGTRTGRLSSSRPNLQQVEKGIHHLFVARPGYKLITYDMSAIEPRLIAYYTHDLNLMDILTKGHDFHNYNTAIFFDLDVNDPSFKKLYAKEREVGKEVALALMYGAGTNRLMDSAQKRGFVWTPVEARQKLERFKEFYEGVYKFRNEVIGPALREGPVTNILGRPFYIDDFSDIHMKGMNTLIQGSASDLVLNSAYRAQSVYNERRLDAHVLLAVHDELVVEAPEGLVDTCVDILTNAMTSYKLDTPLGPVVLKVEGKVASSWSK